VGEGDLSIPLANFPNFTTAAYLVMLEFMQSNNHRFKEESSGDYV